MYSTTVMSFSTTVMSFSASSKSRNRHTHSSCRYISANLPEVAPDACQRHRMSQAICLVRYPRCWVVSSGAGVGVVQCTPALQGCSVLWCHSRPYHLVHPCVCFETSPALVVCTELSYSSPPATVKTTSHLTCDLSLSLSPPPARNPCTHPTFTATVPLLLHSSGPFAIVSAFAFVFLIFQA